MAAEKTFASRVQTFNVQIKIASGEERLTDEDLLRPGADGVTHVGDTTASQAKNGKWVTNQDGMSASLQVPQAVGGGFRYALDKEGRPITMDYRRLPAAQAVEAPAIGNLQ